MTGAEVFRNCRSERCAEIVDNVQAELREAIQLCFDIFKEPLNFPTLFELFETEGDLSYSNEGFLVVFFRNRNFSWPKFGCCVLA